MTSSWSSADSLREVISENGQNRHFLIMPGAARFLRDIRDARLE
jgi:hypothetical protein